MIYLIKFFSDFCTSNDCKINFENICDALNIDSYGIDKKIYFTNDNDYKHAIILNKAMPQLTIPKENVIGFAFEPFDFLRINEEFIIYSKKYIGKYFIGDKKNLQEPFTEGFAYMWHSNPKKEITLKNNCMSIIVSEKKFAPGHIYRHQLVETIIQNKLPIDIYGRGSNNYIFNYNSYNYIKGKFQNEEPFQDYLFSICIENYKCNHYISEKIVTPLMFNCLPIYYGCNNIQNYFDDIIILTGNLEVDIKLLISILQNPLNFYKKTYTDKNKKTVNLIENIETLFTN